MSKVGRGPVSRRREQPGPYHLPRLRTTVVLRKLPDRPEMNIQYRTITASTLTAEAVWALRSNCGSIPHYMHYAHYALCITANTDKAPMFQDKFSNRFILGNPLQRLHFGTFLGLGGWPGGPGGHPGPGTPKTTKKSLFWGPIWKPFPINMS